MASAMNWIYLKAEDFMIRNSFFLQCCIAFSKKKIVFSLMF